MERIEILDASDDALETARALILEYAASRGFPLAWQNFDEEIATLPGAYAPPRGRLLVATLDGEPVGCVGSRPIDEVRCEMKRLYVRPSARGHRLGRLLAESVIAEARAYGYREMLLDTLARMEEANGLYASLGFVPIEAYRYNPLPDVIYLSLDLKGGSPVTTHEPPGAQAPDVSVRGATPADAAAMARIYNQAVLGSTATFDTEPETVEARLAWLADHSAPQHPVLVAEADGEIVGWASLSSVSNRCAYAATVEASTYVDEAFQGRGLGGRLSAALLDAGLAGGAHTVIARVCTENVASLAMCRRLGFADAGVMHEVGRKFGRWLDVATLELILPDRAGDAAGR